MAKHKRLILKCIIDRAKKKHLCRHEKTHVIQKDEQRLTITLEDGRGTTNRYCKSCALKMIEKTFIEINNLKTQLENI